ALQAYRDAVRLDPNNPVFHTDLAMFLGNTGRPEEALPEFTRALELNRASADAHMGLSNCQNGLGLLDEAIVSARKAIDLGHPGLSRAYKNLAHHLLERGKPPQEARQAIDEALRLNSENDVAVLTLAEVLRAQGKFGESLEAYRRGHDLHA